MAVSRAGLASFPAGITANAVTVSHSHPDHSNFYAVRGQPQVIQAPGSYQVGGIQITGLQGDHGLVDGKPTGNNIVFVFEIGGIKIVHMGAAGIVTQQPVLDALRDADVVVLDVMGDEAHPAQDEITQMLGLGVRTMIPAHYSFDGQPLYYGSQTLSTFLAGVPASLAQVHPGSVLEIQAGMPVQLAVMDPSANAQ